MVIEYEPGEGFEGSVEIEMMGYKQRLEMAKSYNLDMDGGEFESSKRDVFDDAIKQYEMVESKLKSVNLKHKESETEVKSLEELAMYEEGAKVIGNIGSVLLNGVRLGKN